MLALSLGNELPGQYQLCDLLQNLWGPEQNENMAPVKKNSEFQDGDSRV